jgi:hypothetical protein
LKKLDNNAQFAQGIVKINLMQTEGIQMLVAQSFYNQVNQMRVYPFDRGIIMKLAGSLAFPILLGTIRIWLPWLPVLV